MFLKLDLVPTCTRLNGQSTDRLPKNFTFHAKSLDTVCINDNEISDWNALIELIVVDLLEVTT